MTIPASGDIRKRRLVLAVYAAALVYFVLKLLYYAVYIGGTPDEGSHIGYLIELVRTPALIPDFASMPMYQTLSEAGGRMVLSPLEGTVNYLGHPPLYYHLLSLLGGISFQPDGTVLVEALRLRLFNVLLTSAAAAMAFRLGYRRLKDRSPAVHLLYAAAVATLPELGYVASGVSNDNLAFFAFALFFSGVMRYNEEKTDGKTYQLIGIGFLLGSFSKLTAALVMIIMLAVILLMSVLRTKSLKLIANRHFLPTLPCYLLFLAYELVIHARYGVWQPSLASLAPAYWQTTLFYVPPENRTPMSLLQYLARFAGGIGHSWSSVYSDPGTAVTEAMHNGISGLVYWVPVAGALAAALIRSVRRKTGGYNIPALLAFFGTLAYHFWTGWTGFQRSGYTGGAQARYYLFLIIPFALAFCELFAGAQDKGNAKIRICMAVLAILLVVLWLAGDAPRMILTLGFSPA